uniref:Uncharacterized protein n=1 Tax=Daphnia magna TaxID=35525 RepID=A0A0N8DHM8_9CRUS
MKNEERRKGRWRCARARRRTADTIGRNQSLHFLLLVLYFFVCCTFASCLALDFFRLFLFVLCVCVRVLFRRHSCCCCCCCCCVVVMMMMMTAVLFFFFFKLLSLRARMLEMLRNSFA